MRKWIQSANVEVDEETGALLVKIAGLSGEGVPYTGATDDVDLGEHSLTAAAVNVGGSDVAQALASKEPALPTASAAGYLHDDGAGNRSWNASVPGGEWTQLDACLSPTNTSSRIVLGGLMDDSGTSLQVGGDAKVTGVIAGGTYGTLFGNTINMSFHPEIPFVRMSLGLNMSGTGYVNFVTSPPDQDGANLILFQMQPPTTSGEVTWEAYQAGCLVIGTTDDAPIKFRTNRVVPSIATIESTGLSITGNLSATAAVTFSGLPTSDPYVAGQLWNDGGTVKISAGS